MRFAPWLLGFLLTSPIIAQIGASPLEPATPLEKQRVELGMTCAPTGPSPLNAYLGYWHSGDLPFVAGLSGGYWNGARGVQLDLGYAFDDSGSFLQLTGLSGGITRKSWGIGEYRSESGADYLAVFYGLRWQGFKYQIGAGYNWEWPWPKPGVSFIAQFGYTFLFSL